MRCPRCGEPVTSLDLPCPHCQFTGAPEALEELAHIEWLLGEIAGWALPAAAERQRLQQRYAARRREMQIELGLRLPPYSEEQARVAWPVLQQRQALLAKLADWQTAGLLSVPAAQATIDQITGQIHDLLEQLEGHARPTLPPTGLAQLALIEFFLQAVDHLGREAGFAAPEVETQLRGALLAEKIEMEVRLGLRLPAPEPDEAPQTASVGPAASAAPAVPPAAPEARPVLPLRDRLWRTLLSERTLQAMLFLGIFLLFSAAISFAVWGWRDFTAALRVAIPSAFTAVFFALGWLVRSKTPMHRSGLALTAIAALLIPVDLYTVYANYAALAPYGPSFWLATSFVCLVAYLLAALLTQSGLFGYLVGAAAGSAALALVALGQQAVGLSLDWRTAALSLTAAGLVGAAVGLDDTRTPREGKASTKGYIAALGRRSRWCILADPFRHLALLTVGAVMLLSLGWRYTARSGYDALHTAMTVNWGLGALILAWGAIRYRSRSLGLAAILALPAAVYMAQAGLFAPAHIRPAWHAFGLAILVPLYFAVGRALLARREQPALPAIGHIACAVGLALLGASALWPLTGTGSSAPAACSHAILAGALVLAALLWQRPSSLYCASFFCLTALTFAMTGLRLSLATLSIGWASLAIAQIVLAINSLPYGFATPLVVAGLATAALSLLPPLFPAYDGGLLAYALGNWLGLAAWAARLAHQDRPGFASPRHNGALYHWLAALPLPLWVWLLFANHGPLGAGLPLTWAALAWALYLLSRRLDRASASHRLPWHLASLLVSVAAPIAALAVAPQSYAPALCLLASGLLYLADAVVGRHSLGFTPGGLVTAWGLTLLLERFRLIYEAVGLALALFVALGFLLGLAVERRRRPGLNHRFLRAWYLAGHLLTLILLYRVYSRPWLTLWQGTAWTDGMRLWAAATQILLGIAYLIYAWGTCRERWAHAGVWLLAVGGGLVAIVYSSGQGTLPVRAALGAAVLVLSERTLRYLRGQALQPAANHGGESEPGFPSRRRRAYIRLAWRIYRRPLLVAGWLTSASAIALALVRNLILLHGRTPQIWAAVSLLLVVALYALAARLFRRACFAWLAVLLALAPWTILTHLGWLVLPRPRTSAFAVSWLALAWLLYLLGLLIKRFAPRAYARPSKGLAQVLVPFSLLWGLADAPAGRISFGLAIALYGLAAILDHRRGKGANPFLYPALGLLPVWGVYLLAWLAPAARHEHYGLLLLAFGPLGLAGGLLLERLVRRRDAPRRYALPAYLTGYVALIVGTLLVAHNRPWLAAALLYDALLLVASAWLFHHPLWAYPAAAAAPLSLLLALGEWRVPSNRQGWWLIGLAAAYLLLAWGLRRVHRAAYAGAPLATAFALIALGLVPSSGDRVGAFWGYGGAALLYALTAFWLRQPLLLLPACALTIVPYGIALRESALRPEYHGLALLPLALAALALGCWLDARRGASRGFPWGRPLRWPAALGERLLSWWALPLYLLGFAAAASSPFFTAYRPELAALNCLLLVPLGVWAAYRFRLRGWLLAAALAGHLAAVCHLQGLGWWRHPAQAGLRFLPVTLLTALVALLIERRQGEGPPLHPSHWLQGWSRPLYGLLLADIVVAEAASLGASGAGALVSLAHALLIAALAAAWQSRGLPFASTALGAAALGQRLASLGRPAVEWSIPLARLALAYGLAGYGLAALRERGRQGLAGWLAVWERALARSGLMLSLGALALTARFGAGIVLWTGLALLGIPFRDLAEPATVQRVVGVLALLGLLYEAAAFARHRPRLGYAATGILLVAWALHIFCIRRWDGADQVQWYAAPAGAYLLGIAALEWQRGNKALARWLDYSALLLMMGSLFWQTLLYGWRYALLLGGEGFLALWWGSARRLRRFLYTGVLGVILATTAQLINALRSINQWVVFGLIGLLVVVAAIVVERKLEDIKAWRQGREGWE